MKRNIMNKKGLGIIGAILIMLVVAVMGVTLASLLGTNTQSSVNYMQSQQAFFLAESGVQNALLALKSYTTGAAWTAAGWTGAYPAGPMQLAATLTGYGDYDVTITSPTDTSPHITSTGYIPNRSVSVKAVRVADVDAKKTNLFSQYAGFAGGSSGGTSYAVNLSGAAIVDSYDSSSGLYGGSNIGSKGDIATNADIKVSGSPHVSGNATTGSSGSFSDPTHSFVSGTVAHNANQALPAVVVPSSLTSLASGGSITKATNIGPGNWKYSSISIKSTDNVQITGPANIYLTGSDISISITRSAKIEIVSGPVVFYADGTIDVAGAGVLNDSLLPSNLQIYGSSATSQDITIRNGGTFYGAIYAPNGNITVSGDADTYGAFIGDKLTVANSGKLHHDISLANLSTPSFMPGKWKPDSWKEIY